LIPLKKAASSGFFFVGSVQCRVSAVVFPSHLAVGKCVANRKLARPLSQRAKKMGRKLVAIEQPA